MTGGGDPGDEDVVGVVDEVIPGEGVDELALAPPVRGGDGDQLTVPRRRRHSPGAGHQVVAVEREERGGDQDHRVVAGP